MSITDSTSNTINAESTEDLCVHCKADTQRRGVLCRECDVELDGLHEQLEELQVKIDKLQVRIDKFHHR